ncbi:uncharacterized protein LOC123406291 isoform X2 [Hordeum vulgare subsp. vulgare]|uniref:uncharacterized protein LOC123406291 isoform X2 n=1 Tax=Hordeum vulgare subsp. vulgare TaxID=112509 RepID=UPI001D1A3A7B|nr:uncharacterized protein LOC123406291 isoform X2 [Hordeum vulgare subsp. vulgare]
MQEYWASVGCRSTGPPSDAGVLGLRRMRRHAVQQHQITTLFLSSTPTCIRQLCRFTSSSINQWLIDIMTVLDFPNQSIEQVGAGTMNPLTFIRVLGREPWNVARCSSLGCSGDRSYWSLSTANVLLRFSSERCLECLVSSCRDSFLYLPMRRLMKIQDTAVAD